MTSLVRPRAIVAVLAAVLLVTLAVPTVDARLPRARPYHVHGPITLDTNLLSKSGVSAWAIDDYLQAHTSLPRLGAAFLAAERKYGVNARFLLAAAMHESAWGRGAIARIKHNLFGYNAFDRDPFHYANAYRSYAANIRATAKFIKNFYLTPGGRWWGGRPTLRSMQQFWSSSGSWGVNVSRIASSIHLDRFTGRSIKVALPVVKGTLHGGDEALVHLTWAGGAIPKGVRFVATWELVALASDVGQVAGLSSVGVGGAVDGMVASPAAAEAARSAVSTRSTPNQVRPKTVATRRAKTESRAITLRVPVPRQPGSYLLRVEMRDNDRKVLPARERVTIPGADVRIWNDRAVNVSLQPSSDGAGAVVTITNTGREAIPAMPGTDSPAAGAPDARAVRSFATVSATAGEPAGVDPVLLLAEPLVADLLPGHTVSFTTPPIDDVTGQAANWLSVGLSVLGDPGWLQELSPVGAWFSTSALGAAGPARADGTGGAPVVDSASPDASTLTPTPSPPSSPTSSPTPPPAPKATPATASAAPSPTPRATPTLKPSKRHNSEHSRAITYRGAWGNAQSGGYIGGNVRWSKTAGSTATFTFTGSSVSWVGPMGATRGRALVIVDGRIVARVDLWRPTFVASAVLFTRSFRTTGHHTLKIKVLATPGRPYVAIDELRVKP